MSSNHLLLKGILQDLDTRTSQGHPTRAVIQAPVRHGTCKIFKQGPLGEDQQKDLTRIPTRSSDKDLRKIMQGPRRWQQLCVCVCVCSLMLHTAGAHQGEWLEATFGRLRRWVQDCSKKNFATNMRTGYSRLASPITLQPISLPLFWQCSFLDGQAPSALNSVTGRCPSRIQLNRW